MPAWTFQVTGATPERPVPRFVLRVAVAETVPAGAEPTPVHSVLLRCQVRIEPARRRYNPGEQARLVALFGTPDLWGQTVRPLPWANVTLTVPAFTGATTVDLPVPSDRDPASAATRYLDALEAGEAPLIVLFSGTIFYEAAGVGRQVAPIPWDREARYRLPVAAWHELFADPVTP